MTEIDHVQHLLNAVNKYVDGPRVDRFRSLFAASVAHLMDPDLIERWARDYESGSSLAQKFHRVAEITRAAQATAFQIASWTEDARHEDEIKGLAVAQATAFGIEMRALPPLTDRVSLQLAALQSAVVNQRLEETRETVQGLDDNSIVGFIAAAAYAFVALGKPLWNGRAEIITPDEAARTTAAFEPAFAGLQRLTDDGALDEADEEFVRNTIKSIELWRQRDLANPQIFELLIADLVRRLLTRLVDVDEMERALVRLGADDETAGDIAARVVASINAMTQLGGSDGARDREVLLAITDQTDRIESALRGLVPPPKKGLARRSGEAAVVGGSAALGRRGAEAGLDAVLRALDDDWSTIRIGLMMGWRAVKSWFLA